MNTYRPVHCTHPPTYVRMYTNSTPTHALYPAYQQTHKYLDIVLMYLRDGTYVDKETQVL